MPSTLGKIRVEKKTLLDSILKSDTADPRLIHHEDMLFSVWDFLDEDMLWELGEGLPEPSDLAEIRAEALLNGDDPDEYVKDALEIARENIEESLLSRIEIDDEGNYVEVEYY